MAFSCHTKLCISICCCYHWLLSLVIVSHKVLYLCLAPVTIFVCVPRTHQAFSPSIQMHVLFVTVPPLPGIQASPPQKPAKAETPAPALSSPMQGQNVLSFSPSRPPTASPKFSPSCVPGYSPPLGSPSTPSSTAGGAYSPSLPFGKVGSSVAQWCFWCAYLDMDRCQIVEMLSFF